MKTGSLWIWPAGCCLPIATLNFFNTLWAGRWGRNGGWRREKREREEESLAEEVLGHSLAREVNEKVGKYHSPPPSSGLAPGSYKAGASHVFLKLSFPNHTALPSWSFTLRRAQEFISTQREGLSLYQLAT